MIAGGQGTDQRFPIHIRNRKDAGCFPMKSTGESDNIGPLRERTREPNRGLDRLGAAAEKLRARQVTRRQLRDQPDQLGARLRSEAADGDGFQLFCERSHILWMGMSETGHRHAGIAPRDVDRVAFYDKPFLKFERLLETYLAFAPRGFQSFRTAMPDNNAIFCKPGAMN